MISKILICDKLENNKHLKSNKYWWDSLLFYSSVYFSPILNNSNSRSRKRKRSSRNFNNRGTTSFLDELPITITEALCIFIMEPPIDATGPT